MCNFCVDIRFHNPRSGNVGSYGNSVSSFGTARYIFQSECTIFTFLQQSGRLLISPLPCQHLFLSVFSIIATLVGVKWHLKVVLIFIFLTASDIERLFMCILAIAIFFIGEMSIQILYSFFLLDWLQNIIYMNAFP